MHNITDLIMISSNYIAQSAGSAENTDCISAEG